MITPYYIVVAKTQFCDKMAIFKWHAINIYCMQLQSDTYTYQYFIVFKHFLGPQFVGYLFHFISFFPFAMHWKYQIYSRSRPFFILKATISIKKGAFMENVVHSSSNTEYTRQIIFPLFMLLPQISLIS